MAKYRAKVDVPPLKAGDIMEASEPLVPEYADKFERVGDDTEETVVEKQTLVNPSRDELKARATELGVTFASNIPTERLMELVKEAEDKKAADEGAGDGDSDDDDDDSDKDAADADEE